MKYSFKALLFVLLVPFFSMGQANYQRGVVVNLKGDTVHGFIDYRGWENNPGSISFKPGVSARPVKLTASDTRYFSLDIGHLAEYVRYAGPISNDVININQIQTGRDTSFKPDTVFLKVLQKGTKLILLSYTDNIKTRFFISRSNADIPGELIYRIYNKSNVEPGENRTAYENTYKSQLYEAAVKAGVMTPALKKDIQTAGYSEADIIRLVSKINGISEKDVSKNNKPKHKIYIAIALAAAVIIFLANEFSAIHR